MMSLLSTSLGNLLLLGLMHLTKCGLAANIFSINTARECCTKQIGFHSITGVKPISQAFVSRNSLLPWTACQRTASWSSWSCHLQSLPSEKQLKGQKIIPYKPIYFRPKYYGTSRIIMKVPLLYVALAFLFWKLWLRKNKHNLFYKNKVYIADRKTFRILLGF